MRNRWLYILILSLLFCSCNKHSDMVVPSFGPSEWTTAKVAVVLPLSGRNADKARYERVWKMFEENVTKAQYAEEHGIKLEVEWFDENTENINKLAYRLYERDDINAVIGPLNDNNVRSMAGILKDRGIPLFVMTSSEDIVRNFSVGTAGVSVKKPFMWTLSETDIVQLQIILAKAGSTGMKKVSLLSSSNEYGKAFNKWGPHYADEMKLDIVENVQYSDMSQLQNGIDKICKSETQVVICALNDAYDAKVVLEYIKSTPDSPKIYFTGSVFNTSLLELGTLADGAEGFSMYPSPKTGFHMAYQVRYGQMPMPIEAQLYDSFLLSLASFAYSQYSGRGLTLNDALKELSDLPLANDPNQHVDFYWETGTPAWNHSGLKDVILDPIRSGRSPELNIVGALGNLKFASDSYTSLVKSTYINWFISDGRPVALDFIYERGISMSSYIAAWGWLSTLDELENGSDYEYIPTLQDGNKAVLICGSEGWYNYRHQADLLYVYSTLKAHNFTDDDIILIMRDDIAYHTKNKYQGVIKASEDGENLYRDVVIDYRADTLGVKDIEDILVGNKNDRLTTVLESTEKDNVLLYWTGHGTNQSFSWLDTGEKFTDRQMERTIRKMYEDKKYLSMLIFTEPCYSGSVMQAIEGIPLVLGITAADNNESSFAENYSDELGVWMCDRFTLNLMRIFAKNPYIDLLDTFKILNASTIGSHVQVYNSDEFYYLGDCLLWSYFKTYNDIKR